MDDMAGTGESLLGWKGFDSRLRCRGHAFEIGERYAAAGEIAVRQNGFHACTDPWDVWTYCGPVEEDGSLSRFARVELSGVLSRRSDAVPGDSNVAGECIVVTAELSLSAWIGELVPRSIEATLDRRDGEPERIMGAAHAHARLSAGQDEARIGSSGHHARIASCGTGGHVASSGYGARIASSGPAARIGSSGYNARIAASGDGVRIGAAGEGARIGVSGNGARIAAGGPRARIGVQGDGARIEAGGAEAVVVSGGRDAVARGVEGTWIALAEYDAKGRCIGFASGCIGQDGLEAGVDYRASGGRLVRA